MLFVGWLDRRNDTNNSLVDAYGRWATIADDGAVTFTDEFRITTQSFPPVFAGSLLVNTNNGYYDPLCPPGYPEAWVNLAWWYPWFSPPPSDPNEWVAGDNATWDYYCHEAGEHNGAYADMKYVYFVWSDNRVLWTYHGTNTNVQGVSRYQPDIRLARLPWLH